MEELKLLIGMVAELPAMALWVLAGFWAYKVICIGSAYGLIRFGIDKAHSYLTTKKIEYKEVRPMLDGIVIETAIDPLIAQIIRLKGLGTGFRSSYVHSISVEWLKQAIDDKFEKDAKQEKT